MAIASRGSPPLTLDMWPEFAELAEKAMLSCTSEDRKPMERMWSRLGLDERLAACDKLRVRIGSGQYGPKARDPAMIPQRINYLRRKMWELPDIAPRKTAADRAVDEDAEAMRLMLAREEAG
jgi:hypothetical protein